MTEQSPVERIKRASRLLRGTLVESLADPLTGAIREDDTTLIKFHGSYQQDNRDNRTARARRKLEPDPARPRFIVTEPGVGYRFVQLPASAT